MEQDIGFDSSAASRLIDKSRVLDVKPMRFITPIFPNPPPSGSIPPEVQPFYPFLVPNTTQQITPSAQTLEANGGNGPLKTDTPPELPPVSVEDNVCPDPHNQIDTCDSEFNNGVCAASNSAKRRGRPRKNPENVKDFNVKDFGAESVINSFLTSFKLNDFDDFTKRKDEKGITGTVLLVYDLIRRHLTQLEESKRISIRRPDLKVGAILMTKGIRANSTKRIGHIPGVEIGDIFFFRMELCIVGLHAPTMAGIDYTSVNEEPTAVSIVSSGGYDDNDGGSGDVLIYTGRGGVQRRDGQVFDQKLERGNLALENSLHRGNEVRVIRGLKDTSEGSNGKIYVYDGLYKIQKSWAEKNKSGCSVFKYKLVRVPGQPKGFSLWKQIWQRKDGNAHVLAGESQPIPIVNDVDGEMGPAYFTYIRSLTYTKPFPISEPYSGCCCSGGCQPGDPSCPCNRKNDGFIPYSAFGVLLNPMKKSSIHECGFTCSCPPNCRNRTSQGGVKVRFEVFKTKNRGWVLRSWDPIRAGGFICEYAGDVVKGSTENDYIFDTTRYYESLECVCEDTSGSGKAPLTYPLVISAKENGNVARFLNHSCCPNVMWRPVLRESNSDSYVHHIAFFAIKHIPPMQELTYDYGIVLPEKLRDERKKKCLCESTKCRGYFY